MTNERKDNTQYYSENTFNTYLEFTLLPFNNGRHSFFKNRQFTKIGCIKLLKSWSD